MGEEVRAPQAPKCSKPILFFDGIQGRRQGRQGVPDVTLNAEFSSAWLNQRREEWLVYAAALNTHLQGVIADDETFLAQLPPVLAYEQSQRDLAKEALENHVRKGPYLERRLGEDSLKDEFIKIRREREYERELAELEMRLAGCEATLARMLSEKLAAESRIDQAMYLRAEEMKRSRELVLLRWARFSERLLRSHPYPERLRQILPADALATNHPAEES